MNSAYVLGASFGEGLAASLIAFPLVYLALTYGRAIPRRDLRVGITFGIAVAANALIALALNSVDRSRLLASGQSGPELVVLLVLPLAVCLFVIYGALPWLSAPPKKPRAVARLDTPAKRGAFLVLLVSGTIAMATVVVFEANVPPYHHNFVYAFANLPTAYWGYKTIFLISLVTAVVAAVVAFFYEQTCGRLLAWIRTGK